jgi:hypothetical protein
MPCSPWPAGTCGGFSLIAAEGLCRADIGDHGGARQLLQEALAAQDPAYSRNRALYAIRLADAALALGKSRRHARSPPPPSP